MIKKEIMKNIVHRIKLSVWVLLVLFVTTSCESWLDVKPKTEEEAERMFSTVSPSCTVES